MITQCRPCGQRIRDCTGPWAGGAYTTSWYHIGTGYEACEGGMTMATPAALVNTRCPVHVNTPQESCHVCDTGAEVTLYFHNLGRCIPQLCLWPHS